MYCKKCGKELKEGIQECTSCGTRKGLGQSYCPECGTTTPGKAKKCPECKAALFVIKDRAPRRRTTAGLLGVFLGLFGAHNFYLGYKGKAICQLIAGLVVGIFLGLPTLGLTTAALSAWPLTEAIAIFMGRIRVDADGNFLED